MQYRKVVPLKDGRGCLLRSATGADGEEVYRFFHLTHVEKTGFGFSVCCARSISILRKMP